MIANYYDITNDVLGKGAFGTVKRCIKKKTGQEFAVKIIAKSAGEKYLQNPLFEAEKCRRVAQHSNVVGLLDTFDQRDALYLVFDLVVGGELMHEITRRSFYSEADGSYCMQQILGAINHCHKMGIVHCDLKPENILLASKERGAAIKIADFGLAQTVEGDRHTLIGIGGTPPYMAPEIYTSYLLVTYHSMKIMTKDYAKIQTGSYDYPRDRHETISHEAKDIIKQMLTKDSRSRVTAAKALKHRWISQADHVAPRMHLVEAITRLKKFNARRKFKGAIFAAVAGQRFFGKRAQRKYDARDKNIEITPNDEASVMLEIIQLTEKLANAWDGGDPRIVQTLGDPQLTTFDPESDSGIIMGMRHNNSLNINSRSNSMILNPHVHLLGPDGACIVYIRSIEYINRNGDPHAEETEETRVWRKRGGIWKNVHFHSGITRHYEGEYCCAF